MTDARGERNAKLARQIQDGLAAQRELQERRGRQTKGLCRRIDAGHAAEHAIVLENRALIATLARSVSREIVDPQDVFQEAVVAFMTVVVHRFDPDKGRLATLAGYHIRDAVLNMARDTLGISGKYGAEFARTLRRRQDELAHALGRTCTYEELAAYHNSEEAAATSLERARRNGRLLSADRCREILVRLQKPVKLSTIAVDNGYTTLTLADVLPGDEHAEEDAVRAVANARSRDAIRRAMDRLKPEEAQALTTVFGLDGGEPATHMQAAERLGVGSTAIGSRVQRALAALRDMPEIATLVAA